MTIQEIIDREMARQGSYEAIRLVGKRHAQDVMNVACARAACLAAVRAAFREATHDFTRSTPIRGRADVR